MALPNGFDVRCLHPFAQYWPFSAGSGLADSSASRWAQGYHVRGAGLPGNVNIRLAAGKGCWWMIVWGQGGAQGYMGQ